VRISAAVKPTSVLDRSAHWRNRLLAVRIDAKLPSIAAIIIAEHVQKPTGQPVVVETVGFEMTMATRLRYLALTGFEFFRLLRGAVFNETDMAQIEQLISRACCLLDPHDDEDTSDRLIS
jgi:hypothetical protein